jgi:hypothetical protein
MLSIKEIKMKEDNRPPITCVRGDDGTIWSPRFQKNTKGEWELPDKEFWTDMIARRDSERRSKKAKG